MGGFPIPESKIIGTVEGAPRVGIPSKSYIATVIPEPPSSFFVSLRFAWLILEESNKLNKLLALNPILNSVISAATLELEPLNKVESVGARLLVV